MTSASMEERGESGRAPELLRPFFLFMKLVHHLHRHRRAPTQTTNPDQTQRRRIQPRVHNATSASGDAAIDAPPAVKNARHAAVP